jgi:hypothetical protein
MTGQWLVRIRRVYEESRPDDGVRVLVDRMWPRGLRKDAVELDADGLAMTRRSSPSSPPAIATNSTLPPDGRPSTTSETY